jgi:NADH-quinone oxidoreductase subunit I
MAYGKGIAKGMGLTLRSMFRTPATIQYPEQTRDVPVYARTNLPWFEERCTGCSTCAQACPDGCILVATSQDAEGRRNIDRYEIDFRICMYCGLCTEACPYEAIQPGGPLDDAVYQFDEMYRDKHRLTEIAQEHPRLRTWVRQLRRQWHELAATAQSLAERLDQADEAAWNFADIREQLRWLITALHHHRAREADLVFEALNVDLGTGD